MLLVQVPEPELKEFCNSGTHSVPENRKTYFNSSSVQDRTEFSGTHNSTTHMAGLLPAYTFIQITNYANPSFLLQFNAVCVPRCEWIEKLMMIRSMP
jgi:hypothetical protein